MEELAADALRTPSGPSFFSKVTPLMHAASAASNRAADGAGGARERKKTKRSRGADVAACTSPPSSPSADESAESAPRTRVPSHLYRQAAPNTPPRKLAKPKGAIAKAILRCKADGGAHAAGAAAVHSCKPEGVNIFSAEETAEVSEEQLYVLD